jgi:hypothetical protein
MEINIMKSAKSWCVSAFAAAVVASSIALPATAQTVVDTQAPYFSRNVRQPASTTTSSVAWVPLYSTTITVPAGKGSSYLRARYTAESLCEGAAGICRVRVVYGNGMVALTELEPASGIDYAFDSTDNGVESLNSMEGHALERTSYTVLPPGMYQVTVQISVDNAAVNFTVDDWHLVLELLAP